ncbi:MAG TPA: hypothetical protein VII92_18570, partial [Anaerolineae bacterium]
KQAHLKGEIIRAESEIDQLETDIDAIMQELVGKANPRPVNQIRIKQALVSAAIQWFLHQLAPWAFRHSTEISRLYEARQRKLARIDKLQIYLRDLNDIQASL